MARQAVKVRSIENLFHFSKEGPRVFVNQVKQLALFN